jgi:hypothetical protein
VLEERYEKTEAGRAEIKSRALVQARVARNLLLVIDASKTGGDWVGVVQGAAPTDLELLVQHQLVKVTAGAPLSRPMGPSSIATPMGTGAPSSRMRPRGPRRRGWRVRRPRRCPTRSCTRR